MSAQPSGSCLTHKPPREGRPWVRADAGYTCCSECYTQLHRWLSPATVDDDGRPCSIPALYTQLVTTRGVGEQTRRGPGFGSRSPADDHVIAMRDVRTVRVEPGDPHSVPGLLTSWAVLVAEERHVRMPPRNVVDSAMFLDAHLDWLTRQTIVGEFHRELRELHQQLRSDARPRPVAHCTRPVGGGECGAPIFVPTGPPRAPDESIRDLPAVRCRRCGESYSAGDLIRLKIAEEGRTTADRTHAHYDCAGRPYESETGGIGPGGNGPHMAALAGPGP